MIVTLDREKKIAVLRWLSQGFIDTHDIAEMGRPQNGIPISRWLDWEDEDREGNTDKTIAQRLTEEMEIML